MHGVNNVKYNGIMLPKKGFNVIFQASLGSQESGATVAPALSIRSSAIMLKYRVKGI
jgi:hypothetical protein